MVLARNAHGKTDADGPTNTGLLPTVAGSSDPYGRFLLGIPDTHEKDQPARELRAGLEAVRGVSPRVVLIATWFTAASVTPTSS